MSTPPWTNAWDETKPADTDLANTLGITGRKILLDIRQRADWQHVWNQNVNDDGGHRFILISPTYHPANVATFKSSGFNLTGALNISMIDLSATWNTSANPPLVYIKLTDTASDVGSKLLQFDVGGVAKFSVDKIGNAVFAGTVTAAGLTLGPQTVIDTSTTLLLLTTSYVVIPGLTCTITPVNTALRIRITACISGSLTAGGGGSSSISLRVMRGAVQVLEYPAIMNHFDNNSTNSGTIAPLVIDVIDSPASIAAQTYTIEAKAFIGAFGSASVNPGSTVSSLVVSEVR